MTPRELKAWSARSTPGGCCTRILPRDGYKQLRPVLRGVWTGLVSWLQTRTGSSKASWKMSRTLHLPSWRFQCIVMKTTIPSRNARHSKRHVLVSTSEKRWQQTSLSTKIQKSQHDKLVMVYTIKTTQDNVAKAPRLPLSPSISFFQYSLYFQ